MNFGSSSVDIVSDGMMMVDGGTVFGPIPKAHWELSIKPDRRNRVRLGLNCLLVRTPGANILVDTGVGSKRTEKLKEKYALNGNKLLKNLRAHGLTARDIDLVILTHLHFDHGGGCTKLDRSGNAVPTFPKAEYMVQKSCLDEAHAPNERFEDSFYDDDFIPLERNGVLKTIDGDTEVIPGLTVRVTDGPSSGHQVLLVERGSERIAFASDLIPHAIPPALAPHLRHGRVPQRDPRTEKEAARYGRQRRLANGLRARSRLPRGLRSAEERQHSAPPGRYIRRSVTRAAARGRIPGPRLVTRAWQV